MITPNNIKKSQAKHILKLIEEMTRAEILARLGPFRFPEFANWHTISLEKKDELLRYIFETSSLVELGKKWKLLKRSGKAKHGKPKKSKKAFH